MLQGILNVTARTDLHVQWMLIYRRLMRISFVNDLFKLYVTLFEMGLNGYMSNKNFHRIVLQHRKSCFKLAFQSYLS